MRRRKNRNNCFPWCDPAWNNRGDNVRQLTLPAASSYLYYNPTPPVYVPPQKTYVNNPFKTPQVRLLQDCHSWGARDMDYPGIQWGAPVYAVEDGQVVYIYTGSNCFSQITSPTSAITPARDPQGNPCQVANSVAIRGLDEYFTEYVHVKAHPQLQACSYVRSGDLIGFVDNSSDTPQPHVHLARFKSNKNYQCNTISDPGFRGTPQGATQTCDWWMVGLS
ncbi:M23 family metallopeptidase [Bacillus cereus]|uniref:M23 family metallopeptidase n=1 Tax=Bacillus cereus TaxID=1396 RepID=UPI000BF7E728|nr:M23 family metallopeptidase [Bacillus cereus]PEX80719.1 hypothetical protein CN450_24905 [Bacillus cereus]